MSPAAWFIALLMAYVVHKWWTAVRCWLLVKVLLHEGDPRLVALQQAFPQSFRWCMGRLAFQVVALTLLVFWEGACLAWVLWR